MYLEVNEVIRRSSQGMTRPFLCRCSDGEFYYVKGRGAGSASLIREHIAGRLGRGLGLPIPDFSIAWVPPELTAIDVVEGIGELGAGPCFASKKQPVSEMTIARVELVHPLLRLKILAFDWWIKNADRTLTSYGGNPNLFWHAQRQELVVLDHNQAFDSAFDAETFMSTHIFGNSWHDLEVDSVLRGMLANDFATAIQEHLDMSMLTIPSQWHYADQEMTVPVDLEFESIVATLQDCHAPDFWSAPR